MHIKYKRRGQQLDLELMSSFILFCNKLINQIKCYSWLKVFEYRKICYHMPEGSQIFYQLALLNAFPVKIANLIGIFVQLQNRNSGRLVTQLSFRINCHIIYLWNKLQQLMGYHNLSRQGKTNWERGNRVEFSVCALCVHFEHWKLPQI